MSLCRIPAECRYFNPERENNKHVSSFSCFHVLQTVSCAVGLSFLNVKCKTKSSFLRSESELES